MSGTSRDIAKGTMQRQEIVKRDNINVYGTLDDAVVGTYGSITHCISTIPPSPSTGEDPVLGVMKRLNETHPCLEWVGYISTTSVYGDHKGGHVWEHSELRGKKRTKCMHTKIPTGPTRPTSCLADRVVIEKAWMKEYPSVNIFRCGGIYGPGRSIIDSLRSAETSAKKATRRLKASVARCHVYDLCQVVEASIERPSLTNIVRIFNVVDDCPASRVEVEVFTQGLMASHGEYVHIPHVQATKRVPSEKVVMNQRIKSELGVVLQYPTYKEGISAIYNGDWRPLYW